MNLIWVNPLKMVTKYTMMIVAALRKKTVVTTSMPHQNSRSVERRTKRSC